MKENNMTADELRAELKVFDSFFNRVSRRAILKDREYDDGKPFEDDFERARKLLADLLGVSLDRLGEAYAKDEFDCDDFADCIRSLVKIINRKRSMNGKPGSAYPIFAASLKENHTINICVGDKIRFGEPQSGHTWSIEDEKSNVIHID